MSLVQADTLASIPQLLANRASQLGRKPFVIDGPVSLSYENAFQQARAIGVWLLSRGCQPGDRIGIWAPNCFQWVVAALGSQLIGATLVTLNTRYKSAEAAQIINQSGCRWLFCIDNFLGVDYPAQLQSQSVPSLENVITITLQQQDDHFSQCLAQGEGLLRSSQYRDRLAAAEAQVAGDTPSDILFTSGTTGQPLCT